VALNGVASMLALAGRLDEAAAAFDRALRQNAGDPDLCNNAAELAVMRARRRRRWRSISAACSWYPITRQALPA
jgi:hypothetical protein